MVTRNVSSHLCKCILCLIITLQIYVRFAILLHLQVELCVVVCLINIYLAALDDYDVIKQSQNYQKNNDPRQIFHSVFQQWLLP